jgi:hypothetical protein
MNPRIGPDKVLKLWPVYSSKFGSSSVRKGQELQLGLIKKFVHNTNA